MPTELLVAGGFYTFAVLAILGSIALILSRVIFRSALSLTLVLASVAGAYVVLGADFLAVVQILVYVGAIMVLIIFGIMLTPQQVVLETARDPGKAVAGVAVAAAVFVVTTGVLLGSTWPRSNPTPVDMPTTAILGEGLLTTFGLPFELASILLLLAMIGAIVIAREE
ncbi:MAG TPA: NADH-quinone oxidoreductase subunit J [Chloroflexota bacterium]|nr:NADH-quinone oxidoreductase subunit J [Chloroflexota bacterium]